MRIIHLKPNRGLLNHSFQGYKLSETSHTGLSHHTIDLPQAVLSQCSLLDDSSELQVLALRMHWNALGRLSSHEVMFFDHEQRLWRIELGEEEICELLGDGPLDDQGGAKFPSAYPLSDQLVLLLRSPYAHLELIEREGASSETRTSRYELVPELRDQPFLFIASVQPGASPSAPFTVALVSLKGPSGRDRRSTFICHWLRVFEGQTRLISQFQSQSRPVIVHLTAEGNLLLGSSTPYKPLPQGPASGNHSTSVDDESSAGHEHDLRRSLKYNWEQDEENLYITIPLDSRLKPQVSISQTEVRVSTGEDEATTEGEEGREILLLECPYGEINPGESSWTTSENQYLLITLRKGLRSFYSWPSLWRRSHADGEESAKRCINREGEGADDDESDQQVQDSLDRIIITLYQQTQGSPPSPLWRTNEFRYLGPFLDYHRDDQTFSSSPIVRVVTSHGDDALAFTIDAGMGQSQHCHSYDAMAFVLGGKASRRYTLFTPAHALVIESRHHVFIYDATRSTAKKNPTQRHQALVSLPDHDTPIIGWALLGEGKTLLLLTPQQLHIVHLS